MEYPSISIIIPTLNSQRTLGLCLESIAMQEYPQDLLEIIIADAGSTDRTLSIVDDFRASSGIKTSVYQNPMKTAEAGKAVGVKHAKNNITAFIDSDNILPHPHWTEKMVDPFKDQDIIASEPIEYTYRATDGYITRYCALLGMNDPLCLFLGNYDRYCTLTKRWTEMPYKEEDKGSYLKIELDKKHLPTIGANGFLIRRSALEKCNIGNYLFDIDVIYELLNATNCINFQVARKSVKFAKVNTDIIHIFSGDIKTFARKQKRRIRDYLYYDKLGVRKYPWKSASKAKLWRFILSCLIVIPLLTQTIEGYIKKPDNAWFFHTIACWLTLWEYGWGRIDGIFGVRELERERWVQ